jgi:hypothetical protein
MQLTRIRLRKWLGALGFIMNPDLHRINLSRYFHNCSVVVEA